MAWGIHAFDEQTENDNTISDGLQDAFYGFGTIGEYRVLAQTDDCIVIRLENETGEGDMIIYRVFDGVFLIYNDFQCIRLQIRCLQWIIVARAVLRWNRITVCII